MNTVINLNVLNFFGFKQNNYTFNEFSTEGKGRETDAESQRIIDITPLSPMMTDDQAVNFSNIRPLYFQKYSVRDLLHFSDKFSTYDRNGKKARYPLPKGLNFNSYA